MQLSEAEMAYDRASYDPEAAPLAIHAKIRVRMPASKFPEDRFQARSDANPDSITMANIGDLGVLIDRYSRTGRIAKGLPIVLSEFGYETNPPDPFSGQPLDRQAEYINEGDYLAAQNPRILSQTQFILRDAGPVLRARPGTKGSYLSLSMSTSSISDARRARLTGPSQR